MEGSSRPIIIKKVKKKGHEHHGGAWKVAYADMVTALMALFIVLWILGQSDEVIASVSGYFNDPSAPTVALQGGTSASRPSITTVPTPPPPSQERSRKPPADEPERAEKQTSAKKRWQQTANGIKAALEGTPTWSRYRDQVELSVTPEGLRINLVESADTPLFKPGSGELNPEAEKIFRKLGNEISRLPNHVAIEGHTDATPFGHAAGGGNWELSTDRAHTARRALVAGGVHEMRVLEIRGMADRQLYNALDPDDSRNRRISVTLLSEEAVQARSALAKEELLR